MGEGRRHLWGFGGYCERHFRSGGWRLRSSSLFLVGSSAKVDDVFERSEDQRALIVLLDVRYRTQLVGGLSNNG